jgi:hypothetical protein
MAMKKSIGRTLAQIDVVANTSVRIHEDFFNSHRDYHHLIAWCLVNAVTGKLTTRGLAHDYTSIILGVFFSFLASAFSDLLPAFVERLLGEK